MQDRRKTPRSHTYGPNAASTRGKIQLVSQVTFAIETRDNDDLFATTVRRILKWMEQRAGEKLPEDAWSCKSFELSNIGSQRTAAVLLEEPKYWAARLDDADKNLPLRTWVTEIGVVVESPKRVLFGCRLICTTRGEYRAFDRSVPGFVKHILAASEPVLDGRSIGPNPWIVSTEDDVDELVQLLERPTRESDVVVLSLPDDSTNIRDAAISAFEFNNKVGGAAHVCVLTGPASEQFVDRVGHDLAVFRKSIRTYRPGFRAWVDQPSNHPLATAATISSWGDTTAPFDTWLVNQTLGDSVYGRTDRLPSFNAVRQLVHQEELTKLKAKGGSEDELLQLFERDNEELRRELREQKEQYDGLLDTADNERKLAVQEAHAAKQQAYERLLQVRALEKRLKETETPSTPIPDTLENFEEWCKEHLGSSVSLSNRAYQGVRKSEYHDPSFIYKSLMLLRDFYVPMRRFASQELRDAYVEELQRMKLEESFTGECVKDDEYTVQYGGRKRPLDKHLKGASARDRRYQFRLYFLWDEDDEVVVVGWLPSHLDNRMS